jgi:hypothetical protein
VYCAKPQSSETYSAVQPPKEAVQTEKEMPLFNEQQFGPHTSEPPKLAASLFEPYKKPSAFLPTEVNSIR